MKKLPIPTIDDEQAITATANNARLHKTSYPHLRNKLQIILDQYESYSALQGNAWQINSTPISIKLKNGLLTNYSSPPKNLNFIKELRDSSPDICPMCGSKQTGTLDHIFPKDDYPEWAVFSKNLVPACSNCNIKRSTTLKGDILKQERILHPYYDRCLEDRLVSCLISSVDDFRIVDICINSIEPGHLQHNSIDFHIEKVLKPSGIIKTLEKQWERLRNKPSNIIHTIPSRRELLTQEELKECLLDVLDRYDDSCGTPNNWDSIFIHGILNSPGTLNWLFNRHNNILTGNVDALSD